MRRRAVSEGELITKVNVVPIIDVSLVLVIILLVTAPLMSASTTPVNLPAAHTREAEDERNVSITLSADGSLAVDDRPVARETLRPALAVRLAEPGNANVLVVVRADSQVPHAAVRELLVDARAAGAVRLAIATKQHTREAR